MNPLRLLWLIARFNDVSDAVMEKSPDGKPFYYTQRFWGAITTIIMGVLAYAGIKSDVDQGGLTASLLNLAEALIPVIMTFYGMALAIKGHIDAKKRKEVKQNKTSDVIDANYR